MPSISQRQGNDRFAQVPERYVFSDFIPDTAFLIAAYVIARKIDHGMIGAKDPWPVLNHQEIAEELGRSTDTVKRWSDDFEDCGLGKITKTSKGYRYEVLDVDFDGDTYRGREGLSDKKFVVLTIRTITGGASPTRLRLWAILDRQKGDNPTAYGSQALLARYLDCTPRQLVRHMNWLRSRGLVVSNRRETDRRHPTQFDQNEYRLFTYDNVLDMRAEEAANIAATALWWSFGDNWLPSVSGDLHGVQDVLTTAWIAVTLYGTQDATLLIDQLLDQLGDGFRPADFAKAFINRVNGDLKRNSDGSIIVPEPELLPRAQTFIAEQSAALETRRQQQPEADEHEPLVTGELDEPEVKLAVGPDLADPQDADESEDMEDRQDFEDDEDQADLDDAEVQGDRPPVDLTEVYAKIDTPEGLIGYFEHVMLRHGHVMDLSGRPESAAFTFTVWLQYFTHQEIRDKIDLFAEKGDFGPSGLPWRHFVKTYGPEQADEAEPMVIHEEGSRMAQVLEMLTAGRRNRLA